MGILKKNEFTVAFFGRYYSLNDSARYDFRRVAKQSVRAGSGFGDKKCGAESSDPNRHSQPRLPGSVVGEASMRHTVQPHKITKVSVPQVKSGTISSNPATSIWSLPENV